MKQYVNDKPYLLSDMQAVLDRAIIVKERSENTSAFRDDRYTPRIVGEKPSYALSYSPYPEIPSVIVQEASVFTPRILYFAEEQTWFYGNSKRGFTITSQTQVDVQGVCSVGYKLIRVHDYDLLPSYTKRVLPNLPDTRSIISEHSDLKQALLEGLRSVYSKQHNLRYAAPVKMHEFEHIMCIDNFAFQPFRTPIVLYKNKFGGWDSLMGFSSRDERESIAPIIGQCYLGLYGFNHPVGYIWFTDVKEIEKAQKRLDKLMKVRYK